MTITITHPTEVEEELSINEEKELAGVTPELQLVPPEYELESAETSPGRDAAEKPGPRIAMMLALGGVGIGTLGIAYFTLINPKAPTPVVKTETTTPPAPAALPDNSAEYKSKLALVDQRSELGKTNQPKSSTNRPAEPAPTTNSSQNNTTPPRIASPSTSYTPIPQPTSKSFEPIRTIDRPVTAATLVPTKPPTIATSRPPAPPVANVTPAKPANLTTTKTEEQTPEQAWNETANLGSYGNANQTEKPVATLANYTPSDNSQQLTVGSRSWGKLETPLEWNSNNNNSQRFLVKLETPILANNGKIALPTGSTLVVEAKARTNSTAVDVFATNALITTNGTTVGYPLNPGAIIVLRKDGKLLRGKEKRQNQFERNIGQSLLSGISKATSLANQSTNQTTFNTGNSFSNVTTNPPPNYLSGFVSGTTDKLVQDLQKNGNNNNNNNNEDRSSYSIAVGTRVQIFVNSDTQINPPPTAEIPTENTKSELNPVATETISPAPKVPSVPTETISPAPKVPSVPAETISPTPKVPSVPAETISPTPKVPSVPTPSTEIVPKKKIAPKPVITLVQNPPPTNITTETGVAPEIAVPNTPVEITSPTVIPTTSSTGILTTALENSATPNQNQHYLVKLTAPLISTDGRTAINQESYLIARVIDSPNNRQLQLAATSALVKNNGIYQEQSLPSTANIKIDSTDGTKLIPAGTFVKIALYNQEQSPSNN